MFNYLKYTLQNNIMGWYHKDWYSKLSNSLLSLQLWKFGSVPFHTPYNDLLNISLYRLKQIIQMLKHETVQKSTLALQQKMLKMHLCIIIVFDKHC